MGRQRQGALKALLDTHALIWWISQSSSLSRRAKSVIANESSQMSLPVTVDHAERAGQLAIANRDPFDRMLIAQALIEDMALVSNETPFDASGVKRLW